ncbi:pyridoxal phosphate-dependent aminotransferase [Fusobacterium sp.]|uniref:pyridoxal phosphate-dependent aminotransferase n=1 Tax=Fusobacterium sp. TaxID=68766 RepID=UPI00290347DE|nr:aminotransferase class I/II-fold pyridoxal phosphate-dependent enzyme [Fusobacterium sp.]MDU1912574.1 aminotransferase class I/II-fold pyridoxal phosphate-dependent enzyme [Fusobacterium sp.]
MEINREVSKLQYSLIRALNEESRKYADAIDLTIGEPDIPSPKELVMETLKYGAEHQLRYPPTGGGEKIRALVAAYYNRKYDSSYVSDNVVINVGASEALSSCLRTILNSGDEVMVPVPFYPGYPPMINLCCAETVFMDITKTDFKITSELLEKNYSDKTKALLLSNPCNPTGNVLTLEEMNAVADFIEKRDIFLISDEIYSELSFYDFHSFSSFEKVKDKLIIINGFSKSHSMTGWRIGYTIFPLEYRKYFLNTTLYTLSSPMALSIAAAEAALEIFEDRRELMNIYKKRALYMKNALTKLGFKVVEPKGAFYIFADYSQISELDSFDFAIDMLKKVQVAVVPGISFGIEKYFRISLTVDISKLKEAVKRIGKYVEENNKK